MGYSVLYIAFGIVALWLLGEVLLQYKARLRWRVLAFAGFLGVVGGVYLREVAVIALGALAFGAGQAFVTLSYKRGFSTGWAIGGRPGASRRRRGSAGGPAEPVLEVTPIEEEFAAAAAYVSSAAPAYGLGEAAGLPGMSVRDARELGDTAGEDEEPSVFAAHEPLGATPASVYEPVPMSDDSGEYPLYDGRSSYTPDPYTSGGYEGYGAQGYAGWGGDPQPEPAAAAYGDEGAYGGGYDPSGAWGGQGYGYDPQQGAYQDPAAFAYGYGTPDGRPAPPYPEQPAADPRQQPQAESYGYSPDGYAYDTSSPSPQGYDPQQPYIPQQQHQPVYEQQPPEPRYTGDHADYADPYDPYRY